MSYYLETLEKLQDALTKFDMSFGVSNKIFRLALVAEILDTTCLFEQLYNSWCVHLPFGEGPDADVDFAIWKEYNTWATLLNGAKQNACIDNFPLDMGNSLTSDKIQGNRRKNYLKLVSSVLRRSGFSGNEATSAFIKMINADKTNMMTFGNMVFEALSPLLLTLSRIASLLTNPDRSLFLDYFERQKSRFETICEDFGRQIQDIMNEDLSDRRKCNKLNTLRDEIWQKLYESKFLDDLKNDINAYDIDDYRKEHSGTNKTEDDIRELLALYELLDDNLCPKQEKTGQYIFFHRKELSFEDIAAFYIYLYVSPLILKKIDELNGGRGIAAAESGAGVLNQQPTTSVQLSDSLICEAIRAALSINGNATSAKWVGVYFAWRADDRLQPRFYDYREFMKVVNGARFMGSHENEVAETGLKNYCNDSYLIRTPIEEWNEEEWKKNGKSSNSKSRWEHVELAQRAAMKFQEVIKGEGDAGQVSI